MAAEAPAVERPPSLRPVMLTFGVILLVLGLALGIGGALLKTLGESCGPSWCGEADAAMVGAAGTGLVVGGFVLGGGGMALVVMSLAVEPPQERRTVVPVLTDRKACPRCGTDAHLSAKSCAACGLAYQRACPQCETTLARDARFCAGCGAAVAPLAV